MKKAYATVLLAVVAMVLLLPVVPIRPRSYELTVHTRMQLFDNGPSANLPGSGQIYSVSVQDFRIDTVQGFMKSQGTPTTYEWSIKPQCCVGSPGPGRNASFYVKAFLASNAISLPVNSKLKSINMLGPYTANETVIFPSVPAGEYTLSVKLYVVNGSSSVIQPGEWNTLLLLP